MKRRIIYVGTLVDLAQIFEPDEQEEVSNHLSDDYEEKGLIKCHK